MRRSLWDVVWRLLIALPTRVRNSILKPRLARPKRLVSGAPDGNSRYLPVRPDDCSTSPSLLMTTKAGAYRSRICRSADSRRSIPPGTRYGLMLAARLCETLGVNG